MNDPVQTVCPNCLALNRVPDDKPKDKANCGKCHAPLFPDEPTNLTAQSFKRTIAKSEFPVLVDFWADWCDPCKQMAPEFAKAAKMISDKVRFAKLDTESAPQIMPVYNIRGIPALILFKEGVELARLTGVRHHEELVDWLKEYV